MVRGASRLGQFIKLDGFRFLLLVIINDASRTETLPRIKKPKEFDD